MKSWPRRAQARSADGRLRVRCPRTPDPLPPLLGPSFYRQLLAGARGHPRNDKKAPQERSQVEGGTTSGERQHRSFRAGDGCSNTTVDNIEVGRAAPWVSLICRFGKTSFSAKNNRTDGEPFGFASKERSARLGAKRRHPLFSLDIAKLGGRKFPRERESTRVRQRADRSAR
jgi:hypothetical protein